MNLIKSEINKLNEDDNAIIPVNTVMIGVVTEMFKIPSSDADTDVIRTPFAVKPLSTERADDGRRISIAFADKLLSIERDEEGKRISMAFAVKSLSIEREIGFSKTAFAVKSLSIEKDADGKSISIAFAVKLLSTERDEDVKRISMAFAVKLLSMERDALANVYTLSPLNKAPERRGLILYLGLLLIKTPQRTETHCSSHNRC